VCSCAYFSLLVICYAIKSSHTLGESKAQTLHSCTIPPPGYRESLSASSDMHIVDWSACVRRDSQSVLNLSFSHVQLDTTTSQTSGTLTVPPSYKRRTFFRPFGMHIVDSCARVRSRL
jgi:hypothetical protein